MVKGVFGIVSDWFSDGEDSSVTPHINSGMTSEEIREAREAYRERVRSYCDETAELTASYEQAKKSGKFRGSLAKYLEQNRSNHDDLKFSDEFKQSTRSVDNVRYQGDGAWVSYSDGTREYKSASEIEDLGDW